MTTMTRSFTATLAAFTALLVQPLRLDAAGPDPNLRAQIDSSTLVQTLDRPTMVVPSNGNVTQKVSLLNCGLPPALSEDSTNKEILSVQVVANGTGDPIAVPGVRRRQ